MPQDGKAACEQAPMATAVPMSKKGFCFLALKEGENIGFTASFMEAIVSRPGWLLKGKTAFRSP